MRGLRDCRSRPPSADSFAMTGRSSSHYQPKSLRSVIAREPRCIGTTAAISAPLDFIRGTMHHVSKLPSQITPFVILLFNQPNLLRSRSSFDAFLCSNRFSWFFKSLPEDQTPNTVACGKTRSLTGLMLLYTPGKVVCHTCIQDFFICVGHDVDEVAHGPKQVLANWLQVSFGCHASLRSSRNDRT